MSVPKFGVGDKVFVKVRGYPPWPARVEGVADETPNKVKYHVYFYGTGETAVCKQEETYPYLDNREKFGKPRKMKGFNEGLLQIEQQLGLSPLASKVGQENENEGNSFIEDGNKSIVDSPITTQQKDASKVTKKQGKSIGNESSEKKGSRNSVISEDSESKVSRSGRQIKRKRVSNNDVNIDEDTTPKVNKSPAKSRRTISTDKVELDSRFLNDGTIVAYTPKGEQVRLKLTLNKPPVFKSKEAKLEWETNAMETGNNLKAKIESGELLPESVKKEIEDKYKEKLVEFERKMALDDKQEKLESLRIEALLLDLDVRIKNSLSLSQAKPENCLANLENLSKIKLSPLMLKKHPEVVETIKKLRKYVGNVTFWKMSEEEGHVFAAKAAMIRCKADHIYNKMKSLFMVPYGQPFWDIFAKELKEFNEAIKGMDINEVFALTNDPTEHIDDTGSSSIQVSEP